MEVIQDGGIMFYSLLSETARWKLSRAKEETAKRVVMFAFIIWWRQ